MHFVILFIFVLFVVLFYKTKETFTPAIFTQLYAKGPQDHYLTADTDKYVLEYRGAPWQWSPYEHQDIVRYYPIKRRFRHI